MLIDIWIPERSYLCDEEGESDVVHVDVGPGNVLDKALASDPGLQACTIKTTGEGDVVKLYVFDGDLLLLVLAERSNRKTYAPSVRNAQNPNVWPVGAFLQDFHSP